MIKSKVIEDLEKNLKARAAAELTPDKIADRMDKMFAPMSEEDSALIDKIVDRHLKLGKQFGARHNRAETRMDLMATHNVLFPLRLRELLDADDFNFTHDVCGIRDHLNRQTLQMERCFVPRFAKREGSAS